MMDLLPGGPLFWTTLAAAPILLVLANLIGRAWARALPWRLDAPARFYLAPALGIATLTILASVVGRYRPLGDTLLVPWLMAIVVTAALATEARPLRALRQSVVVAAFGIVCGVTMLAPLYAFGGFNSHNDAFTYLVHGAWLQDHAFADTLVVRAAADVQIGIYQERGFRMGASYLLALSQAILNLRWSYDVYPAVVIASIGACCLALGYPLAGVLRPLRRSSRLALLAVPGFSCGGLVFGANYGFLPQTMGLALACALLFLLGPSLLWAAKPSRLAIWRPALPLVVLLAGTAYCYSELIPFLGVAMAAALMIVMIRSPARGRLLRFALILAGLSVLLLNAELLRIVTALQKQAGVVVGGAVDWPAFGFLAHAIGIHGGAWSQFQWTRPDHPWTAGAVGMVVIAVLLATVVVLGARPLWRAVRSGPMLPTAMMLIVLVAAFCYFRYLVPSPFATGVGQSWSQFKLANWAHPFFASLLVMAVAVQWRRMRRRFDHVLPGVALIAACLAAWSSISAMTPIMHQYSGVRDLGRFYAEFRQTVATTCPTGAPVYLALGGKYHKLRQMALLFLPDREVHADWTDDGYFFGRKLGEGLARQPLAAGDCLVEPLTEAGERVAGAVVGPFHIGSVDRDGMIRLGSAAGAFNRESDGKDWWHWVGQRVTFGLQPLLVDARLAQTRVRFQYGTRDPQTLTIRLVSRSGKAGTAVIKSAGEANASFDQVFDLAPADLAELVIDSDGRPTPLSATDGRVAAWIIRNVAIVPVVSR